MTISDINRIYDNLSETIENLNKIIMAMQSDPEIETRLKQQAGNSTSSFTINGAKNQLIEYQGLLKSIMQDTKVQWPPRITIAEK